MFPRTARLTTLYSYSRRISTTSEALPSNLDYLPVELDESYKRLTEDIDISLKTHQTNTHSHTEFLIKENFTSQHDRDEQSVTEINVGSSELVKSMQWKRKSAAARFGSDRIAQFKLPFELVTSMQSLIDESDKHQLRSDAKRLLTASVGGKNRWIGDTPKYDTRREERIRGSREGLAYAVVTLPGQVTAIRTILREVKLRSPLDWTVNTVLDFGSQTGAAFWATLTFFGNQIEGWDNQETLVKETSLKRYIGFDNRRGLTSVSERIGRDLSTGGCNVMHRQFWRNLDEFDLEQLHKDQDKSLAISAFVLSQLPTPAARKQLVKEIWESEAETIILVDQGTSEGFRAIADAREYLLRVANAESSGTGAHVVAPCPHDGDCPLKNTPDRCTFRQRFHRPEFQKKTKHANYMFEDVHYSYVVIKRGRRPLKPAPLPLPNVYRSESRVSNETEPSTTFAAEDPGAQGDGIEVVDSEPVTSEDKTEYPYDGDAFSLESERQEVERKYKAESNDPVLQEFLRQSSYYWRRTIYNPMKGSGHVTLDTCTPNGQIARIVIPKSQGKAEYYDARKSDWGDLFPHEPKNGEAIRKRGIRKLGSVDEGDGETEDDVSMEQIQALLESLDGGKGKNSNSMRKDKVDRRDNHRKRKQWKKDEEQGYTY
ncbi:37S ribosomal protein S22 [Serendipita sp. 399]|nr:37S ribosomal protein S22 [Serendipita sp. 399]